MILRWVLPGSLALCSFIGAATAQSLPEGKGRAEVQRICGNCHGVDIATKPRLSADQWSAVVDEMASRGAQGTDDDFELIVKYLAKNFSKPAGGGDVKAEAGQKIAINSVSARKLADGLGISQSDAGAIVEHRTRNGAFKDWTDLRKVSGIDLKKLEEQKDRILFTPPAGENHK